MIKNQVIIHTDGGSRGNPGPAGIGVVLEYGNQKKTYAEFIGDHRTNNEAEYEALIYALKKIKSLLGGQKAKAAGLKCYSDSELMVKQLNHEYKLKDAKTQKNFIEIWNLIMDFGTVEFHHVRREENQEADKLANMAMDQGGATLGI